MKQFGTILNFELQNYFKNKLFMGITVFLVAVIAVIMFFPRFTASEEKGGPQSGVSAEGSQGGASGEGSADSEIILLSAGEIENKELLRQAMNAAFPEYEVCLTEDDVDTIKEKVTSEAAAYAFVMDSPTSYTYYVNNLDRKSVV